MERRSGLRIDWDSLTKYRVSQTGAYKAAILKNASTGGAMLWLKEDISVGNLLEVLMESKDDPHSINMHMRVVRVEETPYEDYKGYACKLEMVVSVAA